MKKIVRSTLFASSVGAIFLPAARVQAQQSDGGHYNIVYIMTDDHTAQMMSCYDNRYVETPNLDRIANDGVRFVRSYVANSLSGLAGLVC